MSVLDADFIYDILLYKLKRNRFSNNEERISKKEDENKVRLNVISTERRMSNEKSPSFIE